jgi:hypothetical protein
MIIIIIIMYSNIRYNFPVEKCKYGLNLRNMFLPIFS